MLLPLFHFTLTCLLLLAKPLLHIDSCPIWLPIAIPFNISLSLGFIVLVRLCNSEPPNLSLYTKVAAWMSQSCISLFFGGSVKVSWSKAMLYSWRNAQPTIQLQQSLVSFANAAVQRMNCMLKKFLMQLFSFISSAALTCVQSVRVVDNFVQSDTFKVELLPHCTLDWIPEPSYVQNSKHIFSKLGGKKTIMPPILLCSK